MAYDVDFTVPSRPLGKTDIRFVIRTGDGVLGTLRISKGALVWFPKKTNYGHKVPWHQFHRLITENINKREYREGT
jgi:hypothetical protein